MPAKYRSDRQRCTATGTAACQDFATIGSGHAGTETVGAFAFQDAGLKSTFHGCSHTESGEAELPLGIGRAFADLKESNPKFGRRSLIIFVVQFNDDFLTPGIRPSVVSLGF